MDCYKHCVIIVNELLCYVSNYIMKSSLGQLKLALLSFYSEEAVNEAKRSILDTAKEMKLNVGEAGQTRQRSATRSAKEAEIDDILKIFNDVAKFPGRMVSFYAQDVTKLPPAAPEEGGCLMSLFELMASQKRDMMQMQKSMADLQVQVSQNTTKLEESRKKTYSGVITGQPRGSTSRESSVPRSNTGMQRSRRFEETAPNININMLKEAINQVSSPAEEGFQVSKGNGKRMNKGANKGIKTGAAEKSGTLFSGPEKIHVQLTNVSPQITEDRIKNFIEEKGDDELKLITIKDTTTEGWETKRFLLTFGSDSKEKVLDNTFWPQGIYFKQWFVRNVQSKVPGIL